MPIPISTFSRATFLFVLLVLAGCASTQPRVFDKPAPAVPSAHKEVFDKAFEAQERGQYTKAIGLWKEYLRQEPESAAAHNNLGMIYYTEDRLPESIQEFEQAMTLVPGSPIVQGNLSRSLQFEIALLKENREYERAIQHLKRLQEISAPEDFQKVQFMIEEMEDKIFEQVQNANTAEEYRRFLERYPKGVNAQKAREKLAEMERHSSVARPFEDLLPIDQEGVIKDKGGMEAESPIMEESVGAGFMDIPEETADQGMSEMTLEDPMPEEQQTGELQELPMESLAESPLTENPTTEEVLEDTAPVESKEEMAAAPDATAEAPMTEPAAESKGDTMMARTESETAPPAETKPDPKPTSKVVVTLKSKKSLLNVRAEPTIGSKVLSHLRHGDVRPLVRENPQWFQIEYKSGKTGWIHKSFSRKLEASDAGKRQPQAGRILTRAPRLSFFRPVHASTSLQPQIR